MLKMDSSMLTSMISGSVTLVGGTSSQPPAASSSRILCVIRGQNICVSQRLHEQRCEATNRSKPTSW